MILQRISSKDFCFKFQHLHTFNMSRALDKMQFDNAPNTIWTITFFSGICILLVIIILYVRTMQHLHCIPKSNIILRIEPKNIMTYSTLAVSFAALCCIIIASLFPICAEWKCHLTMLAWVCGVLRYSTYILAKIFLYRIFIARLFNPYYHNVYRYSKWIRFALWLLLIVLVINLVIFFIYSGFWMAGMKPQDSYLQINVLVHCLADITLSTLTLILFFHPLCRRGRVNSSDKRKSILMKYGIISALQFAAAITYQINVLMGCYLREESSLIDGFLIFIDIRNFIQMIDCLLLVICVHSGFARKQTVCFIISDGKHLHQSTRKHF